MSSTPLAGTLTARPAIRSVKPSTWRTSTPAERAAASRSSCSWRTSVRAVSSERMATALAAFSGRPMGPVWRSAPGSSSWMMTRSRGPSVRTLGVGPAAAGAGFSPARPPTVTTAARTGGSGRSGGRMVQLQIRRRVRLDLSIHLASTPTTSGCGRLWTLAPVCHGFRVTDPDPMTDESVVQGDMAPSLAPALAPLGLTEHDESVYRAVLGHADIAPSELAAEVDSSPTRVDRSLDRLRH